MPLRIGSEILDYNLSDTRGKTHVESPLSDVYPHDRVRMKRQETTLFEVFFSVRYRVEGDNLRNTTFGYSGFIELGKDFEYQFSPSPED